MRHLRSVRLPLLLGAGLWLVGLCLSIPTLTGVREGQSGAAVFLLAAGSVLMVVAGHADGKARRLTKKEPQ